LIDDLPALVWAANLAALELHVPQWTVAADGSRNPPDRLLFDLDPGPGATIVDCARVAERLRELLVNDGLTPWAKTTGSKGMQLYASIQTANPQAPSRYAKALAEKLSWAAGSPGASGSPRQPAGKVLCPGVSWCRFSAAAIPASAWIDRGHAARRFVSPSGYSVDVCGWHLVEVTSRSRAC
jgi:bifunctional non-homologous end joining protein LigD